MADKRITDLPDRAVASDDYLEIDGLTNGSARLPVGRAGGPPILNANGEVTDRLAHEGVADGVAKLNAAGMPITAANEAVVESGSNSNGYWIKLADGTQICWHRLPVSWPDNSDSTSVTWTFPVAFASTPQYFLGIAAGGNAAYLFLIGAYNESTGSVQFVLKTLSAQPAANRQVLVQAVGRWK